MSVQQALGGPRGRRTASAWLGAFIDGTKAPGFVAAALRRHRIDGTAVAPRAG